jgi:hypothetical protein
VDLDRPTLAAAEVSISPGDGTQELEEPIDLVRNGGGEE